MVQALTLKQSFVIKIRAVLQDRRQLISNSAQMDNRYTK
jgi:hypothetical protein